MNQITRRRLVLDDCRSCNRRTRATSLYILRARSAEAGAVHVVVIQSSAGRRVGCEEPKPPKETHSMILIAAMSNDRVIGAGDGMPWNVPEEYEHFLRSVADATVIIGRRSYDIFGPDLGCRHTLVVTRSPERVATSVAGVETAEDVDAAIGRAQDLGRRTFSAGGQSVYEQTLPLADELHLSTIKGAFEGDAHFPEFDERQWQVAERRDFPRYEFVRWVRRSASRDGG